MLNSPCMTGTRNSRTLLDSFGDFVVIVKMSEFVCSAVLTLELHLAISPPRANVNSLSSRITLSRHPCSSSEIAANSRFTMLMKLLDVGTSLIFSTCGFGGNNLL